MPEGTFQIKMETKYECRKKSIIIRVSQSIFLQNLSRKIHVCDKIKATDLVINASFAFVVYVDNDQPKHYTTILRYIFYFTMLTLKENC